MSIITIRLGFFDTLLPCRKQWAHALKVYRKKHQKASANQMLIRKLNVKFQRER